MKNIMVGSVITNGDNMEKILQGFKDRVLNHGEGPTDEMSRKLLIDAIDNDRITLKEAQKNSMEAILFPDDVKKLEIWAEIDLPQDPLEALLQVLEDATGDHDEGHEHDCANCPALPHCPLTPARKFKEGQNKVDPMKEKVLTEDDRKVLDHLKDVIEEK